MIARFSERPRDVRMIHEFKLRHAEHNRLGFGHFDKGLNQRISKLISHQVRRWLNCFRFVRFINGSRKSLARHFSPTDDIDRTTRRDADHQRSWMFNFLLLRDLPELDKCFLKAILGIMIARAENARNGHPHLC